MSTQQKSIEELVDSLSHLSVLDMAKLKTALEDKWGVKAAAAAPMMAQVAAPAAEAAVESTEFEVSLVTVDSAKKMAVIKVVREVTGLGLKESKEFAEAVTPATPKVIKPSCSKQEADEICTKFKDSGGEIKVKGL
ncbi:50S ribosomal protein L7/L12 [Candidatus Rhabdochlamydia sp. T3358]|uniref:50S ribosomal protein L7/L12 n=1 Tax=Candidatus Rhabdochlamydia sp. T3358 TaxID=2099795 RepID=UPI0010B2D662|nr:50S ribosomal protein L7/L12 [Candidatus Rhabdochlamydia sp. T3358]VHO03355.1 50S ribosomal protein L7/L12 [Candidatus Rhabdochlamydia sp. T3358]